MPAGGAHRHCCSSWLGSSVHHPNPNPHSSSLWPTPHHRVPIISALFQILISFGPWRRLSCFSSSLETETYIHFPPTVNTVATLRVFGLKFVLEYESPPTHTHCHSHTRTHTLSFPHNHNHIRTRTTTQAATQPQDVDPKETDLTWNWRKVPKGFRTESVSLRSRSCFILLHLNTTPLPSHNISWYSVALVWNTSHNPSLLQRQIQQALMLYFSKLCRVRNKAGVFMKLRHFVNSSWIQVREDEEFLSSRSSSAFTLIYTVGLYRAWNQHDTSMTPAWHQHDTSMKPAWHQWKLGV